MSRNSRGILFATLSGIFYGIVPIIMLSVTRSGAASSSFCILMRTLGPALLLAPLCLKRLRKKPPTLRFLGDTLAAAAMMSATSLCLFTSYQYIPTGIGITLHYTHPLLILCINLLFFHAVLRRQTLLAMLLSIGGVVLLCDPVVLRAGAGTGIAFALISSCTLTGYLLWVEHRGLGREDPIVYTALMCAMSSVIHLIYNAATGQLHLRLSAGVAAALLATAVLGALTIMTQALALRYAGSVRTSILGTLEPIICTLGSALVLHETLSLRVFIGCTLTLAAVILVVLEKREL